MKIREIYVRSFGALTEKKIVLTDGLNLIYGENESGKTSLAHFLKFIFYGFGPARGNGIPERDRYVHWNTGVAGGYLILEKDGKSYRIERTVRRTVRAKKTGGEAADYSSSGATVTDLSSGTVLPDTTDPGRFFFGMTEEDFVHTVFVNQSDGPEMGSEDLLRTIENRILTGNDHEGTEKAIKTLDEMRRPLYYQNGKGGQLFDVRQKLYDAKNALAVSSREEQELVSLEEKRKRNQEESDKKKKELSSRKSALGVWSIARKAESVMKAREMKENAERIKKEAEEIRQNRPDRQTLAALLHAESSLSSLESEIEKKKETVARLTAECARYPDTAEDLPDASADSEKLEKEKKKRKTRKALAVVFLILFLLLLGGAVFAYFRIFQGDLAKIETLWLILGAAALTLCLGLFIVFASLSSSSTRTIRDIGIKWNVDPFEKSASEEILETERIRKASLAVEEKKKEAEDDLRASEAAKTRTAEEIRPLAEKYAPGNTGIQAALREAAVNVEKMVSEDEEKLRSAESLETQGALILSGIGEEEAEQILRQYEEIMKSDAGRSAASLSEAQAQKIERETQFFEASIPMLKEKVTEAREKLAALRATHLPMGEVLSEVSILEEKEKELAARVEAIDLAKETLQRASDELRQSVLPRVLSRASEELTCFSSGKYTSLVRSGPGSLSFFDGSETHPVALLSEGTRELVYVALRMGLVSVLESGNDPVIVFDEAFAAVDDRRLENVMRFLAGSGMGQILTFSCRTSERDSCAQCGGTVVSL
ncbi:MAG: AAA family ATPase [Clostridia bacterium]|nr:AAA family ATPase [Clostridia bacterium]